MPLDFCAEDLFRPVPSARVHRGKRNHLAGLAAEDAVARDYAARGWRILARRWRCQGGEIDLIAGKGDDLAIVEVKCGATHDIAAGHLTESQMRRLGAAAEEYLFGTHLDGRCSCTPVDMRFDLALVDGQGRIDIAEAAFFL